MRWAVCMLLLLTGCEKARQDMYDQPKYKPMAASPLFPDGGSARVPPAGVLAASRGPFADSSSGRQGQSLVRAEQEASAARAQPYPINAALLARGQQRYDIFCLPCHGAVGAGDGRVVQRGFPAPVPLAEARLRGASDRHLYEVISEGYGIMYPFGDKIEASDRWAVVAFVRALQLSQHAELDVLPPDVRRRLPAPGAHAAEGRQ